MSNVTLFSDVSSHAQSFVLGEALKAIEPESDLAPALQNGSSIDGDPAGVRKIPKRLGVDDAVNDSEGQAFTAYQKFGYTTAIELTPTGKVAGFAPTVKSLRRRMPGLTNEQVVAALQAGSPVVIPMMIEIYADALKAHSKTLARATMALYASASKTAGETKKKMSFAYMLDAKTKVNNDIGGGPVYFHITNKALGELQEELIAGSGSALSSVWGDQVGREFLAAVGGADSRAALAAAGALGGSPVYIGSSSMFATANAGDDRVSFCGRLGRGPAGGAGLRGYLEVCEGHAPKITLTYDDEGNIARAIARSEWAAGVHTNEFGAKIITAA